MKFFTSTAPFSHTGRFYGVPIYLNLDERVPVISGQNIVYDWLFMFMTSFHNTVVEFGAQFFAYLLNQKYEPGFPIWITGEIQK